MELYILKSSACLAILMLFYKLVLESTSAHIFKRFYLLSSLLIAFAIPFITFTEYVEPVAIEYSEIAYEVAEIVELPLEESINYWPFILWTVYGLGVMVFFIKFCYNLSSIISRIRKNPKQKSEGIINVLVQHLKIPHTFFSYIFLNKQKFEKSEIPKEVLIHEQAHAFQKHSIDVLLLELLQIVFWFNPLMYLLKQDVKLNHEYLADRAVLQNGISPSTYQTTLLAFTSKGYHQELANAINYSSIKKRFKVMKTHTSKQKVWSRSALLLPLVALLLYGFSEKKEVIKVIEQTNMVSSNFSKQLIIIAQVNEVNINGKQSSLKTFANDLNLITKGWDDIDFNSVIPDQLVASCSKHFLNQLNAQFRKTDYFKKSINRFTIEQRQATAEEMAEYNKLAKHYNNQSADKQIIKLKDMKRIKQLYDKMSKSQRTNAEPFPNFPPPPPPPAAPGSKQSEEITYLPPPPPPANPTAEQRKAYEKAISNYKGKKGAYTYKQKNKEGELIDVVVIPDGDDMAPPPPPPLTAKAQKVTDDQIEIYNTWAKSLKTKILDAKGDPNKIPIVKQKDVQKYLNIYQNMTEEQRMTVESPPVPPPLPIPAPNFKDKTVVGKSNPSKKNYDNEENVEIVEVLRTYAKGEVKTGFIKIKGVPHYFVTIIDNTRFYNRQGFETNLNGVVVSKSQINASDVVPGQYITKVYSNDTIVAEFKNNRTELKGKLNIPPPPPPPPISPLDHVIDMAKKGATFYYEGEQISSDKAIDLLKKNKNLNINSKNTGNKPSVYISKNPIDR